MNVDESPENTSLPGYVFFQCYGRGYLTVIADLVRLYCAQITTTNATYFNYVLMTGIRTSTHVYRLLSLYNDDITSVLTSAIRGNFFFVEFVGQIGEDHHTFLRLDVRDASLFVYKKTLFELDEDKRTDFGCGHEKDACARMLTPFTEVVMAAVNTLFLVEGRVPSPEEAETRLDTVKRMFDVVLTLAEVDNVSVTCRRLELVKLVIKNMKKDISIACSLIERLARRLRDEPGAPRLDLVENALKGDVWSCLTATESENKCVEWLMHKSYGSCAS